MIKTPRRRAREFVVQGIYQWQLNHDLTITDIETHLRENEHFIKADLALFDVIFRGVLSSPIALLTEIEPYYDRPPEEVSPVEKSILMLAAFELINTPETPYPVIINEAIELTKTFGGTDGHKFVNGILDRLAADKRPVEVDMLRDKRKKTKHTS